MNDEHGNAIKIAVIEEQIQGLREQAKSHAATTKEQFENVIAKLEAVDDRVAEIQTSAKVGWKTLVGIGSAVTALIGIAFTAAGYFRGN